MSNLPLSADDKHSSGTQGSKLLSTGDKGSMVMRPEDGEEGGSTLTRGLENREDGVVGGLEGGEEGGFTLIGGLKGGVVGRLEGGEGGSTLIRGFEGGGFRSEASKGLGLDELEVELGT